MAKNKDIENPEKQKSNIADKAGGMAAKGINRIFVILNVVAFVFLAYQIVAFIGSYSKKSEQMFSEGRIINIDPKTNALSITDITEAEIAQKRADAEAGGKVTKTVEELVGPMPLETKPEDIMGPMPADAAKAVESAAPLEPAKPVDYKTANLSIIVTEIGQKNENFELAKTLPKEVSFAFSPYSDDLQKKIDTSAKEGRMVLLNLMMQPSNFPMRDSGPLSIQVNYDENQNIGRFEKTMKLANRFSGLLASNDEMVTSKFDKLAPILKKISERGIFFGYYRGTNNLNVENDAKPLAADIFGVDYLIDADADPEEMAAVLNQVKENLVVKKKKTVIVIRPYPNSIKTIKEWLKANLGENIQMAPISYFVTNN